MKEKLARYFCRIIVVIPIVWVLLAAAPASAFDGGPTQVLGQELYAIQSSIGQAIYSVGQWLTMAVSAPFTSEPGKPLPPSSTPQPTFRSVTVIEKPSVENKTPKKPMGTPRVAPVLVADTITRAEFEQRLTTCLTCLTAREEGRSLRSVRTNYRMISYSNVQWPLHR